MSQTNPFNDDRIENLRSLENEGCGGYPHEYPDVQSISQFREQYGGEETIEDETTWSLGGRVTRQNTFGDFGFHDISDGTTSVQTMFVNADVDDDGTKDFDVLLNDVNVGDVITVTGTPGYSDTGELTLFVNEFTVVSKALQDPQSTQDDASDSGRVRQRTPTIQSDDELRSTLQSRFEMTTVIRQELLDRQFTEVETPILQQFSGGAEATPFQTYCEALDEEMFLRIAPELYLKRLVVGGFNRVFEVARNFRNESIDTTHNPEFTMLELYETYADYNDMMELTEQVVATAAEAVAGDTTVEYDGEELDFEAPWRRASFDELVQTHADVDVESLSDDELRTHVADEFGEEVPEDAPRGDILMELYDEVVEPNLTGPVFVTEYPRSSTPLCKTCPDDETRVERFEAVVAGTELANAYTELIDPRAQVERLTEQADDPDAINQPFVQALAYGMPPTGGLGIGIDRLAMLLTDSQSIKDVLAFPMTTRRV